MIPVTPANTHKNVAKHANSITSSLPAVFAQCEGNRPQYRPINLNTFRILHIQAYEEEHDERYPRDSLPCTKNSIKRERKHKI